MYQAFMLMYRLSCHLSRLLYQAVMIQTHSTNNNNNNNNQLKLKQYLAMG